MVYFNFHAPTKKSVASRTQSTLTSRSEELTISQMYISTHNHRVTAMKVH